MNSNNDYYRHQSTQEYRHRCYCIAIGALIGIFIQLSSLCSNTQDFYAIQVSSRSSQSHLHDDVEEDIPSSFLNGKLQPESSQWKIGWSIIATTMGIILLLTLRAMVLVVLKTYVDRDIQLEPRITQIRNMEHSVATGTLWGVSLAWIITDYILGFSIPHTSSADTINSAANISFSYWYVPTLVSGIALLAWHIVVQFVVNTPTSASYDCIDKCNDDNQDQLDDLLHNDTEQQLRRPLLHDVEKKSQGVTVFSTTSIPNPTKSQRSMIQILSFGAGLIIGIFIQCSTLGVTYMEQFIMYSRTTILSSSSSMLSPQFQDFSFRIYGGTTIGISFIMSCFGLMLLLYIRTLITSCLKNCDVEINGKVKRVTNSADTSTIESSSSSCIQQCSLQTFILIHIEAYLATGTVVGLNIAWMVTDYTLFFLPQPSHSLQQILPYIFDSPYWYQSIMTLVVSTLWCPLLLFCTGFFSFQRRQPEHDNEDDNDDDDEISCTSTWKDDDDTCNDVNNVARSITPTTEYITSPTAISNIFSESDDEMAYM